MWPPPPRESPKCSRDCARSRRAPTLDEALGGGLPRGRVVEVGGPRGSGRLSLALSALRSAQAQGEWVVLVDVADAFDPRASDGAVRKLVDDFTVAQYPCNR